MYLLLIPLLKVTSIHGSFLIQTGEYWAVGSDEGNNSTPGHVLKIDKESMKT